MSTRRQVALSIFTWILVPWNSVQALTLQEALERSIEVHESVQVQALEKQKAQAIKQQAIGQVLPSVRAVGRLFKQDIPPTNGGVPSSFREPEQTTVRMELRQPIYQGGAAWAGLNIANSGIEQSEAELEVERRAVKVSVSQLYYDLIRIEKDLSTSSELLRNLDERVKELTQRSRIGRTKAADLLSARTQRHLVQAELTALEAQRDQTKKLMASWLKLEKVPLLQDQLQSPEKVIPLPSYVERIDQLPQIKALRAQVEASEANVRLQKSGHWPTLDVEANYYIERPGVLTDSEWDVALNVSVPIYSGGVVSARTREASYSQTQAELQLQRQLRELTTEVENLHRQWAAWRQQIGQLTEAVAVSERNYRNELREYRQGLIPYLEVIQIESDYWQARRLLERAQVAAELSWVQLQVITGQGL